MLRRVPAGGLVGAALVVVAGASTAASAHHSASSWGAYYRERYLVCTDQPWTKTHCVGGLRNEATIIAAIHDGTPDDSQHATAAHGAAIDAVYFHLTAAIPELRTLLQGFAPSPQPDWRDMESHSLQAEAAYALANLGDTASGPAILQLVQAFETTGHGSLWIDTLDALALIDPAAASRYAIDFVGRNRAPADGSSAWYMSMPGGTSKLDVLPYIRVEEAALAKPVLARAAKAEEHGYDPAHCQLMAARVRIDPVLRAQVRKLFVGSYSGSWLAGCANDVLPELGTDGADVNALVRHLGRADAGFDFGMANIAYRRLLGLLASHTASAKQRAIVKQGLVQRSKWPHLADPTSRTYQLHYVVFHRAALAALGDAASLSALWAIVDDPAEQTGAAWLGALWGLRLGFPDAVEHAAALIERGATYANSERTGLYQDLRMQVLDAFVAVAPTDPRWAVLLLDFAPSLASERAQYLLSRLQPAGACAAVTRVAPTAQLEAVEHALLALTVFGDQCRPAIEALFADPAVPPKIRGAALEVSAALRSPSLAANLQQARADKVWKPAIDRAALLARGATPTVASPARPPVTPRVNQPLPPKVLRQGL